MDSGFVGQIVAREFSYLSVQPLGLLHGRSTLTVLADGFISNVGELELEADRRGDRLATSLTGWIGLAYCWWGQAQPARAWPVRCSRPRPFGSLRRADPGQPRSPAPVLPHKQ